MAELTIPADDGLDLAAWATGPADAPPLLFVHGYPEDHTLWDRVVDDLAADHRCVTVDVRGAGRSDVPATRAGWRMERLLADLDAVLDATVGSRPVHLVGHDWGSIQSWAYVLDAGRAPRVATFTSMSGPPLHAVRPYIAAQWRGGLRGRVELVRQVGACLYIAAFQTPVAPWAWRRVLGPRWPRIVRMQHGVTDASWPSVRSGEDAAVGVELYRAHRRAMLPPFRTDDLPPVAAPTAVPVLVLVSTDDESVRPALVGGLDAFATDLRRVEMRGGHWLARSCPGEVAAAIRAHVERGGRPAVER